MCIHNSETKCGIVQKKKRWPPEVGARESLRKEVTFELDLKVWANISKKVGSTLTPDRDLVYSLIHSFIHNKHSLSLRELLEENEYILITVNEYRVLFWWLHYSRVSWEPSRSIFKLSFGGSWVAFTPGIQLCCFCVISQLCGDISTHAQLGIQQRPKGTPLQISGALVLHNSFLS